MITVFPLIMTDKYYNIQADKLYTYFYSTIVAAVLLLIYIKTRDSRLSVFVWSGMILDMLCMGFNGYGQLVGYTVNDI